MPKVLIASPSPRDLQPWKDGIDSIKCVPKLLVKYYKELEAYTILRDYFLDHQAEFDYLALVPDDLIVNQSHYDALVKDIEDLHNPPVISGICNYDLTEGQETRLCITIHKMPNMKRGQRPYAWADLRNKDHPVPVGIIPVKFSGFPFMFIRRDVVEQIPFEGDIQWNFELLPGTQSQSFDLAFCYLCEQAGIPVLVDTRVLSLHMKGCNKHIWKCDPDKLQVGIKKARVIYVDEQGNESDITADLPHIYKQTEDWYRKLVKV